jgi:valyl-tRNA synthetase
VKDRLYKPDVYGENKRRAAQYTLHKVLYRVLQLLAPITPHIAEEIYQTLYAQVKEEKSINLTEWPSVDEKLMDEEAEKEGDLIMALISEVRREKSEKHLPLNSPIKKLTVYANEKSNLDAIIKGRGDIAGACKIGAIETKVGHGKGREIAQCGLSFIAEY